MKTLVMVFCLMVSSGCSVYMAAKGEKEPNLGAFGVGASRGQVEQQLGSPVSSVTLDNGERQDLYEYTLENEPSAGRAIGHGVMDVLTIGLWEVVGTPIEAGNQGDKKQVRITYSPENKVKSID